MIIRILNRLGLLLNKIFVLFKNFFKLIVIFLLVIILGFGAIELYQYVAHGYKYSNDVQCIDKNVGSEDAVDEIIYKYETSDSEILFYYSESKKLHVALLEKKLTKKGWKYSYSYSYGLKHGEVFYNYKSIKDSKLARFNNIRYTFFKNKSDVAYFDVDKENTTLVELENIRNDGSIEKFWACFVLDD